jgi:hypothetical protein
MEFCGDTDEKEHIFACQKCKYEITTKIGGNSMDMSNYAVAWLNAEAVSIDKANPTRATILDEGIEQEGKFGKKPVFTIRLIDGSKVKYRPSKTSISNIIKLYGPETMGWIGKEIKMLSVTVAIGNELKKTVVVLA